MRVFSAILCIFVFFMASCEPRPFMLYRGGDNPDGGIPDDSDISDDADSGTECIPPGVPEVCNGRDDDCDGVIDNGFDLDNDPENCGQCGRICAFPNAESICIQGNCVFVECLPGWADLDPEVPGCEYRCPVYPPQPEECNGIDDNCDGRVDEPENLPPPPTGVCRTTPGTPCEGTVMICATRGQPPITTWYCDYSTEVEFDPRVPNGIVLEETLCDGHDGDCDGAVDETFTDLGQECDNGLLGACRDMGLKVCNPGNPYETICDLSFPPDPVPGAPFPEVCNGIDDNCDGIVDNFDPGDPDRVIDDMVYINHSGLDFYIYRHEASRPDATGSLPGSSGARPCSRPGVLPWSNVTFSEARSACERVGKRLCTGPEWQAACAGAADLLYPYGQFYEPLSCNGVDYGSVLLPTGLATLCESPDGLFDMSGNLREWTNDLRGTTSMGDPVYVIRGGEYHTPYPGLTCHFDLSQAAASVTLPTIGFRCCSDTAP